MSSTIRTVAVSLLLVATSLSAAGPAAAVAWKSKTDPLYGYEDGHAFGKVYGNFYNDGSVRAMSTTYQYDLQPGGNYVRVETDFYWKKFSSTCGTAGVCWAMDTSKQTEETRDNSWVKDARARNLDGNADGARGGINICEIQAWHNDPCSAHAWPSFSY